MTNSALTIDLTQPNTLDSNNSEKITPQITAEALPSVYAEAGWVNPHTDFYFSGYFPEWNDVGFRADLQAWDLATEGRGLFIRQMYGSSPKLKTSDRDHLQIHAGLFDREVSVLATPGPILETDETILSYASTLPSGRELGGAQLVYSHDSTIGIKISAGGYGRFDTETDEPTLSTNTSLFYGAAVLSYGEKHSGSLALGAGMLNNSDFVWNHDGDDLGLSQQGIPLFHAGLSQNFAVSEYFTPNLALLYGLRGAGKLQRDPGLDYDVELSSQLHSVIPQAGFTGSAGPIDYGAYFGYNFIQAGDTNFNGYKEIGVSATAHVLPHLDIIGVATFYETDAGLVPSGEGKIKIYY